MPVTHEAGDPEVDDTNGGRVWRWRTAIPNVDTTDLIRFPCPSRTVALTMIALADADDPTVTTFQPQLGYKDNFTLGTIDGRVGAATAEAPSRSQTNVNLDLVNGALFVRPVLSAGPKTVQVVLALTEGHRG